MRAMEPVLGCGTDCSASMTELAFPRSLTRTAWPHPCPPEASTASRPLPSSPALGALPRSLAEGAGISSRHVDSEAAFALLLALERTPKGHLRRAHYAPL